MNRKLILVGAAALALLVVTGLATATGGTASATEPTLAGFGPADDATLAERTNNGTNSTCLMDDERLDRMQERFDLTDEQVSEIQTEVQSLVEENATRDEIRAKVTEMLESYGVEDPTLGPPSESGFGPANDTTPAEPLLNGSNSPWVTGDERLDRMQERFDLTDEQVSEIQTEVQSLVEENATRDEIRATVTQMLESYGVEDPTLGPPADRGSGANQTGQGQAGHGHGAGNGNGPGHGQGQGGGAGPHGPADGSCMN